MISDTELDALRVEQEAWMLDDGVVTRGTGDFAFDSGTGEYVPDTAGEVYSGKCRVMPEGSGRVVVYGENTVTVSTYDGTFPAGTNGIEVDDILTLTESADDRLIGRPLVVTSVTSSTLETARRITLEDHLG